LVANILALLLVGPCARAECDGFFKCGDAWYYDVEWDEAGRFMLAGFSSIYSSQDGAAWKEDELQSNLVHRLKVSKELVALAEFEQWVLIRRYDDRRLIRQDCKHASTGRKTIVNRRIALLGDGVVFVCGNTVSFSKDGVDWADVFVKRASFTKSSVVDVVATPDDRVIVLVSGDDLEVRREFAGRFVLVRWERDSRRAHSIAYNGRAYVLAGDDGLLAYSTDAKEWGVVNSRRSAHFRRVEWTGREFAVLGSSGEVMFSKDGVNWMDDSIGEDVILHDIAYGNGRYVVVGKQFPFVPRRKELATVYWRQRDRMNQWAKVVIECPSGNDEYRSHCLDYF
jgi:hypothetical protein